MSIPITACLVAKAANGNGRAYQVLKQRMEVNARCAAFSIWECVHQPPCHADEPAIETLIQQLETDLAK